MWTFIEYFYVAIIGGPGLTIAMHFFRRAKDEHDSQKRAIYYAGVAWSIFVVLLVILTKDYLFERLVYS